MNVNKKNIIYSILFFISFIFYFPIVFFIRIFFIFEKKKKIIYQIIFQLLKFDNFKKKNINYDNEYLVESSLDWNLTGRTFYIDSSFNFYSNLKFIVNAFKNKNSLIIFRSDLATLRTTINISIIIILNKFYNLKFLAVSNDTQYYSNIFRSILLKKNNIFLFVEDRNLILIQNYKSRACSFNLSKKIFFNDDFKNKKLEIGFIGRFEGMPDREEILSFLKKNNLDINIFNRDRNFLDRKNYFKVLRNIKILINFTKAPQEDPLKKKFNISRIHFVGRATHGIASGCLLLEPERTYLSKNFLIKNRDFVSFKNKKDLLNKLIFHKENFEKSSAIAKRGQESLYKLYQNQHAWKILLEQNII